MQQWSYHVYMTKVKTVKAHIKAISGLGGAATFKKYGPDHMSKIAKLRWAKQKKEQNGKDHQH